jgi:RNA polymerase sigma-70 factor (sigma-E family)
MDFEAYARRHHKALLRFAVTVVGDPRLAEEIVQDVLLRAFQRWASIGDLDHPHAYVRRMVVNEYLSWRRRWSRVEPRAHVGLEATEPDQTEPHAERDALVTEILRLPRRQRVVLALRYFEDVHDAEIARTLGCSQATVRSIAARALARLRIRMADPDPATAADPGPAGDPQADGATFRTNFTTAEEAVR